MGVEVKNIQAFIWRVLKFSINICIIFVRKHPFVSSLFLFLFSLYFFLPKIFIFLIYSSPLIACTALFIRFQRSKIKTDLKKDRAISSAISEPKASDLVVNKDDKSCMRRNVKEQKKELEATEMIMQEKDIVSSTTNPNEGIKEEKKASSSCSVSRNVSIGENIAELNKGSKSDVISLNGLEEQAAKFDGGGGGVETELENSVSSDDEEGETKEAGNKAVEWNEDDQKNLMDLGISELERNKRLESLIARRKVRKLFKMQTEKILISSNFYASIPVAPVCVSRGNPFDVPDNPDEQGPGSAPSVLLPTRNPFDLPYDQFEEKPDLSADSFQQEFMAPLQKDLFFCRHESFTLGHSFSLDPTNFTANNRFRRQQPGKGEKDLPVHNLLLGKGSQDGGEGTLQRNLSVTDLVAEGESSSKGTITNQPEEEDGEAETSRIELKDEKIDNAKKVTSSLETESNSQLDTNEKNESNSSSDSDQVIRPRKPGSLTIPPPVLFRFPEVSINTPPPNSTPCPIPKARSTHEQLSNYAASPATIDRSRIENHLLYTNTGPWHTPTNSIASDMQVEVSEIGSPPLTGDGSASSNDGGSLTYDGDVEKEITSGSDEMWGNSPHAPKANEDFKIASTSRTALAPEGQNHTIVSDNKIFNPVENAGQETLPENSMEETNKPHEGDLQQPKEPKPAEEVSMSYNVDTAVHGFDDLGSAKSIEEKSESSQNTERKSLNILDQSVEEASIGYILDQSVEEANILDDPVVKLDENRKAIEDIDARIEKYIEQEVLVDLSKRAEESTSEDKNSEEGKENSREVEVSTSGTQLEMTVEEQVSTNSSSPSSPTSILPARKPLEKTFSDLSGIVEATEFDLEETIVRNKLLDGVRNKLLDEQELENLPPTPPRQNAKHLTDQPSIDSKSEKAEETSDKTEEMFTRNEPMKLDGEPKMEDLKSVNIINGELQTSIDNEETSTSIKNAVADEMTIKEKFELVIDGESESHRLDKYTDTNEQTSRSIEDTEAESRNLQLEEESKSSNNLADHTIVDDEIKAPISEASDGNTEAP